MCACARVCETSAHVITTTKWSLSHQDRTPQGDGSLQEQQVFDSTCSTHWSWLAGAHTCRLSGPRRSSAGCPDCLPFLLAHSFDGAALELCQNAAQKLVLRSPASDLEAEYFILPRTETSEVCTSSLSPDPVC